MIWEDQFFVVNVLIIDPTWEMVALNVINRLIGVVVELSAIVNICNYRGLHEGHHFISMAMDVHDTPEHDMDCFIKECARLFHDKYHEVIYPFFLHSSFQATC